MLEDRGEARVSFIVREGGSEQAGTHNRKHNQERSQQEGCSPGKHRELSGQATFLITPDNSQPRRRKGCPYPRGVVSRCVTPDTCVGGSGDLASNWRMNQSMRRALFPRKRENIEQGAYVDGVTVSKPRIERDWRWILPPQGLGLFLRAQVMLIKQPCLRKQNRQDHLPGPSGPGGP